MTKQPLVQSAPDALYHMTAAELSRLLPRDRDEARALDAEIARRSALFAHAVCSGEACPCCGSALPMSNRFAVAQKTQMQEGGAA
jgi:hypothetical protein